MKYIQETLYLLKNTRGFFYTDYNTHKCPILKNKSGNTLLLKITRVFLY